MIRANHGTLDCHAFSPSLTGNGDELAVLGGDMRAEASALAIQRRLEPIHIGAMARALQPKPMHLVGHKRELGQGAVVLKTGQVRDRKIATILLVTFNALVVADEIAAAIEDRPVAIDLDPRGWWEEWPWRRSQAPASIRAWANLRCSCRRGSPNSCPNGWRDDEVTWPP